MMSCESFFIFHLVLILPNLGMFQSLGFQGIAQLAVLTLQVALCCASYEPHHNRDSKLDLLLFRRCVCVLYFLPLHWQCIHFQLLSFVGTLPEVS